MPGGAWPGTGTESTSTVSLSMAALGYRNASVRFPLASRNVCPNNGIETRGKFHFGGAKGLLAQLTLHCHLAAGLAPSPHYYHHSFPMQGRNGGPVRIVAISHLLERKHTVQSNRRQSSPPHGTRRHQCESKCMPRRKLLFLIRNLGMICFRRKWGSIQTLKVGVQRTCVVNVQPMSGQLVHVIRQMH
jgi:hypothetical protein